MQIWPMSDKSGYFVMPGSLLSEIRDMASSGFRSLAVQVFFASFPVPLFKFLELSVLSITTRCGTRDFLCERTLLYRVVDSISRWSMIDVFMASVLTAAARLEELASVFPGLGASPFRAVVVLTLRAARNSALN